jgi:hypothetical protein
MNKYYQILSAESTLLPPYLHAGALILICVCFGSTRFVGIVLSIERKNNRPLFFLGLLRRDFFILVHVPCIDELGDLSPTSFIKNIKEGMPFTVLHLISEARASVPHLFTKNMIVGPAPSCSLHFKSQESSPTLQHEISRRCPFGQNTGSLPLWGIPSSRIQRLGSLTGDTVYGTALSLHFY